MKGVTGSTWFPTARNGSHDRPRSGQALVRLPAPLVVRYSGSGQAKHQRRFRFEGRSDSTGTSGVPGGSRIPVPTNRPRRGSAAGAEHGPGNRVDRWHRTHDRVWLGERFWANPMEDWRVVDGAAEVQTSGGDRNVHLITHRLTGEEGRFRMSVRCRRVETGERDGGAGFRIGIRNLIDDHRSNCFARGVGVDAGMVDGRLVLGDASGELAGGDSVAADGVELILQGRAEGGDCELTLAARDAAGDELGSFHHTVPAARARGQRRDRQQLRPGDPQG